MHPDKLEVSFSTVQGVHDAGDCSGPTVNQLWDQYLQAGAEPQKVHGRMSPSAVVTVLSSFENEIATGFACVLNTSKL